jgi:hypothetical protein
LELDDDLAHVVRQLASRRELTMGQVVSELVEHLEVLGAGAD